MNRFRFAAINQFFDKVSQEVARKGIDRSVYLQKYKTDLAQELNSLLGKLPNFSLNFEPNIEPDPFEKDKTAKIGLKATIDINAVSPEQEKTLTLRLPAILELILKPSQEAVGHGTAVFVYDLKINQKLIQSNVQVMPG